MAFVKLVYSFKNMTAQAIHGCRQHQRAMPSLLEKCSLWIFQVEFSLEANIR